MRKENNCFLILVTGDFSEWDNNNTKNETNIFEWYKVKAMRMIAEEDLRVEVLKTRIQQMDK